MTSPRRQRWSRIALLLGALVTLLLFGRSAAGSIPAFSAWVEGLGIWGPIAFVAGYAIACVLFVPASLLTLASGAIFGLGLGIALVLAGATLGAVASFLIARHAARNAVKRYLSRNPRLAALDQLVAEDGLRIVLLLRLSPVFPFGALNYALGATRLRFSHFLAAMIGVIPGTTLYVYSGTVAGTVAGAAGPDAPVPDLAHYAVLAVGLIATLVVTVLVTRAARRALDDAGVSKHGVVDTPDGPQPSPDSVSSHLHQGTI